MAFEPLVTIFTPSYNHEKYLDEYFQGLLSQTYRNIQLIIVDDDSTDRSWDKICSYEAELKRKFSSVIIERHENIGPLREMLRMVDKIEGEFYCVLESDDYYLPTKIEENVRYLQQHPDVGVVHSEIDYIYGNTIQSRHWETIGRSIPCGEVFQALLLDNFIMTCSVTCRTDLFRKYANIETYISKGYIAPDYPIFLDLARHTRFGYINKSLARYRVLPNSLVHSTNLARAYHIERNYQQVKLDFMERYGGSQTSHDLAIEGLYQADFIYGYRMFRAEQCLAAYRWLMQQNPERYSALPFRLLAFSVEHRLLWWLVRRFESMRVVQDVALGHFRLRHRGSKNRPEQKDRLKC